MTALVAYVDRNSYPGVQRPGYKSQTYDWRAEPGSAENTARIQDHYTVAPLEYALHREYTTDALLVSYVLFLDGRPLEHQPRVTKPALSWIREQGYEVRINTLFVDIDNPGHAEHTELTIQTWASRLRRLLPGFGFYVTPRGVRVVAVLASWVEPETAEEILETIFRRLEALDIAPAAESRKCRDWTRHMRPPHIYRDDLRIQYRSPIVELSTLQPQVIEPTPIVRRRAERSGPARAVASFVEHVPAAWNVRVERLGELLRGGYQGRRHDVALALAGALLGCQVAPELVPAIVGGAVSRAGWNDPPLHERAALDTVAKWEARDAITGLGQLKYIAPDVADAVEVIASATAEDRARHLNAQPPPPTLPVDVALEQLRQEIRNAYGLVVLRAQCGLGKSHAAREVAAERAAKPSKPDAKRAPNGSKTGFAVPNHDLAIQHAERLRAEGTPVRRVFGVLSVLREDGTPECRYAKQAKHVLSGQSIPRVFCEGNGRSPCEHRETCSAYGGTEGPDDARVIVGTHALLSQIDAEVGSTGLLVVDEPPDLLETQEFTAGDFELTMNALGYFSRRYARAMAPAVQVIWGWLIHTQELNARENNFTTALSSVPTPDIAQRALEEVGTDDPREAARRAFHEDHDPRLGKAPPIEPHHLITLRESEQVARNIGRASRVLRAVWNACQEDRVYSTRVEEHPDRRTKTGSRRVLLVTGMRTELADALAADHPTVVLDANADLQVPIYQRVIAARELGGVPREIDSLALRFRYREFYADEGAPIERCMIMWGASRKAWFEDGQLAETSGAVVAVERAVRWVLERPDLGQRVCVVTYLGLAVALRAALGHPGVAERWGSLGQDPAALGPLAERLRGILAALPGTLEVAHYGRTRGLDHWMGADALITLGDPVPNLGALRHDAAFMGLQDADGRAQALARAELEQAHGRLRTVHRTRPARMLHVGRVLPGGWHGAEIRGRSRAEDWARGGAMGAEHGIKGKEHGIKGAEHGWKGAEHGIKGKEHGIKGKEHGVMGAEHGIKGKEHGMKGAEFGKLGAEHGWKGASHGWKGAEHGIKGKEHGIKGAAAGAAAAALQRNQSDMTAGEVQVRISMLGGNREAAKLLGLHVNSLLQYKNGTRRIPQEAADKLRAATSGENTRTP